MPAAAVPEGAVVIIPGDGEMLIDHVENSTPRAGQITWHGAEGLDVIVGGNVKIEVVSLP